MLTGCRYLRCSPERPVRLIQRVATASLGNIQFERLLLQIVALAVPAAPRRLPAAIAATAGVSIILLRARVVGLDKQADGLSHFLALPGYLRILLSLQNAAHWRRLDRGNHLSLRRSPKRLRSWDPCCRWSSASICGELFLGQQRTRNSVTTGPGHHRSPFSVLLGD